MEKKETTASELSQMEEKERGGWMDGWMEGKKEGVDRSQLMLAIIASLLRVLTVRRDNRSWKL